MRKILISILLLFSCSPLPPTIGKLREVIIFTEYQNEIAEEISKILEKKVYTPQPESYFTIRYKPFSSFPLLKDFTTLFLIGTITDEFISDLVGDKIEIIKRDTFGFFRLKDLYTKNQQIFIFVSNNKNLLKEGLKRYEKRIFYSLLEHIYNLIHLYTYSIGIDKKKIKYLKENYRFTLKVPKKYILKEEYKDNNFIYLFTHYPDRSIFVYFDNKKRDLMPKKIADLRDSLTIKFYNGDYILREYTFAETTYFLNQVALKLIGVWQNDRDIIGGPFISYAFNYQDKFFLLDGTLFYPGEKKLNNLLQLDVILNTFEVE
ncbi:MAG: DUF4837 family protein [candidate division WOR-3 bacterium]|nr:DUF4837 family protein [candidate division WOR-3 bacterium]MCX7836472.1 DUF4837 family protein [candidate division WOR-3 bacterium]